MKNFCLVFSIAALLLVPAALPAAVETELHGGLAFAGSYHREIETRFDYPLSGYLYGAAARYTQGPRSYSLGAGLWYLGSAFTADTRPGDMEITRHSFGPDVIIELGVPSTGHAFTLRGGVSMRDWYRLEQEGATTRRDGIMGTGLFAAGFAWRLDKTFRLSAEYLYVSSYYSRSANTRIESHGLCLGLKIMAWGG